MLNSDRKIRLPWFCAALLIVVFCLPAFAATIPDPTSDFYVNDFAGILSQETCEEIMRVSPALADQTGAQVVVVTLNTIAGEDSLVYATELFRTYGIGDREHNRGVLLLLIQEDREVRIEVGYGLEGAINDAKAGRILDTYVIPFLKNDQWDEGVLNGFNALVQEVKTEFAVEIESGEPYEYKEPGFFETWSGQWLTGIVISLILGAVLTKVLGASVKWYIWGWLGLLTVYFLITSGVLGALAALFCSGVAALVGNVAVTPDTYSSRNSSRDDDRYRNRSYSNRNSGGGSSGGGGYSGGGGSSGGGGASRKF